MTTPLSTTSTIVSISGMTCAHCVAAVTEALEGLPDVRSVSVDLREGALSTAVVISGAPLRPAEIEAAVAEAGYATTDIEA